MSDLPSPVALITGAGSGIGRATAIALAKRGWRMVLVGRTESKLDETKSLIADCISEPVDFMSAALDLTDPEMPQALIDGIEEFWGRLDALINNAGLGEVTPLAQPNEDLMERTFATNTFAVLRLIQSAWPLFEKTKRDDKSARPCVINVTSMATVDPFPGLGVYAASKCAAESFVRSIKNERGDLDLRAFAIAPGAVETPMLRASFDESIIPAEYALDPEIISREIIACIEGDRDDREGESILLPSPAMDDCHSREGGNPVDHGRHIEPTTGFPPSRE